MQRTTFPEHDFAWKKEVERLFADLRVGQARVDALAGATQSQGVVIGGTPPTELQCMQFNFDIALSPVDCQGCDGSQCKTLHLAEDIMAGSEVAFAAGDYVLTRNYSLGLPCHWRWDDPEDETRFIHYNSPTNVALTFQGEFGSLYYQDAEDCETLNHDGGDPAYTSYPPTVTVEDSECEEELPECGETVNVLSEIKWNEAAFKWIQSIFKINGHEGGGTIDATYSGATFTLDFDIDHDCYTGNATYHAPVYVDDHCRPVIARRATPAAGWPTAIASRCVDCTPQTTTTDSTTTESTTTDSTTTDSTTTGSTTTDSTTTDSTTTGSTTTGSTTTGSTTTTDSTTTGSTTTGSSSSSTESTTTGSTTTGSTTPPSCENDCEWTWTEMGNWVTTDSCASGCQCAYPEFNGTFVGDTTFASCIPT